MAEPTKPAATSGPGALSKRTDGGPAQKLRDLPNAQYGEAQTFRDLQKGAPLAQAPQPGQATATSGSQSGATPSIIPLNAPTTRPNEPVTAGADAGPGPGLASLGLGSPQIAQWRNANDMLSALAQQNPNDAAIAYLAARLKGRY